MLIFAKSAYMPNAVDEGRNSRNNTKAFGFNAHAEGMNCTVLIKTRLCNSKNWCNEHELDYVVDALDSIITS